MKKILIIGIAILYSGCSQTNAPSEREVEKSIFDYAVKEASSGDDVLEIEKISKTDGLLKDSGRAYIADFNAKVKFKKCGYNSSEEGFDLFASGSLFCKAKPGQVVDLFGAAAFGKGYALNMRGQAEFLKKESGWKLVGVSVGYDDPIAKKYLK